MKRHMYFKRKKGWGLWGILLSIYGNIWQLYLCQKIGHFEEDDLIKTSAALIAFNRLQLHAS